MSDIWNFTVILRPDWTTRLLTSANIADEDRIRRIASLTPRAAADAKMVGCRFAADDSGLQQVLQALAEEGWEPVFDLRFNDPAQKKFLVRRTREHDPKEEKAAEFLLGWPSTYGGWVYGIEPPDTALARCEPEEAKKPAAVIALPGKWPMTSAWSEEAMQALRGSGLKGAAFHPIQWQEKPKRRIWHPCWLGAERSFPPTLTPRVGNGRVITDNEEWCSMKRESGGFDDEAFEDYRLAYRRSDLQEIMDVDVSCTWELSPAGSMRLPTHMIFSQRFRQWCIKQGIKYRWRPLRLLDE